MHKAKKKEDTIEIETQPTNMDLDFGRTGGKINIDKEKYDKYTEKYGAYGGKWYITAGGGLKYFKNGKWHFEGDW